jgi:8-oxo-dGTP pyrophosphatase MutT (NUDIX family)
MEVDRPGPGEELNTSGGETVPRLAASIIVLRGGADALDVLLVRRTPEARFMGGVWVFPGGAVDAGEDEQAAALRELQEEAGITLADPSALVRFSQWITPAQVKIRFDTHFFLAPAPDGPDPVIDGSEIVDWGWFSPGGALESYSKGELELVFPTIKHLEQLAQFASADELLAHARGREVQPITPKVIMGGETARVVLPGEPGYDEA